MNYSFRLIKQQTKMSETGPIIETFQQFRDDNVIHAAAAATDDVDRFANLLDTTLNDEQMEQNFNQLFQMDFTIREVKLYLERKIWQIEGQFIHPFEDIRRRLTICLGDEDTKTMRLIESSLIHIYRIICCSIYNGAPFSIVLQCQASTTNVCYTPDGVMVPARVNSDQTIDTPQKALFYGFILCHYYGAMLAYVESRQLQTNEGDLRYVFYCCFTQ